MSSWVATRDAAIETASPSSSPVAMNCSAYNRVEGSLARATTSFRRVVRKLTSHDLRSGNPPPILVKLIDSVPLMNRKEISTHR